MLAIENARLFQEARRARTAAEATLADLRRAQDRLVQSEKMASLGQLTAGIAHEIKNPLNFVNNFSDLSVDLLDELHEAVAPDKLAVAADLRAEIDDLTTTLKGNLEKIAQHGRRADSIVKNMLLHSRSGPSEHRAIDLNTTVEEALNLAYHGARAETPGFNITMEKDLDPQAGAIDAFPQEFLRVMLNLINNGFYAARKHADETTDPGFEPTIRLTTRDLGEQVEIRVRDNGTGISDAIRDKLFQPFFTTKPTGEGTGLGLSISYDIVTKQHGGNDGGQPGRRLHRIRRHPAAQDGGQRRSADMTDLLPSAAADIERMEGELQALRSELAARNSEFGERIEHQAATIEVLKAMSASPGDAQPVFDLIARQAAKLCNVPTAAVATFDGTMLHLATQSGFDAANADAYVSQFPRPVGLDSSMGRAILNRRVEQVDDITADSGHSFGPVLGHWSVMAVPILRDGVPLAQSPSAARQWVRSPIVRWPCCRPSPNRQSSRSPAPRRIASCRSAPRR